jgi:hypothetical protein
MFFVVDCLGHWVDRDPSLSDQGGTESSIAWTAGYHGSASIDISIVVTVVVYCGMMFIQVASNKIVIEVDKVR